MRYAIIWGAAVLRRTEDLCPDIRLFEIVPSGGVAQPYEPGSHLNVEMLIAERPDHRSYSLVGESGADCYRIAVKRQAASRGGSASMWSLAPGARLSISTPHNLFGLDLGRPEYLLVAGGIGITPLVGMAERLHRSGANVRFVYACRNEADAVFATRLAERLGERFRLVLSGVGQRLAMAEEIATLKPGGQLYICGPIGLLDAARAAWHNAGRPAADLRFETFGSGGRYAPEAFTVTLPRLGRSIRVREDETMLEALEKAGLDVLSDCRRGECGLCALDIVGGSGAVDHRDVFFSDAEKRANTKLCACVSRVRGGDIAVETAFRP